MIGRLAELGVRHPRRVSAISLVVLLAVVTVGSMAPGVLKARNDFEDPGSQSAMARKQLERVTGAEPAPGILALVQAAPGGAEAARVANVLREERSVAKVFTYADTHDPSLRSGDGRSTLIAASLRRDAEPHAAIEAIEAALKDDRRVLLGGSDVALRQVDEQASQDLGVAETLAFPLVALLALLIFRGVAVLLPLLVAIASVFSAFTALVSINTVMPVSIFALNLVFGLGLGLAVDYSLFLVTRFREELGREADVADAVRTTMATAGRTVLFSALTVAAASASLVVFPLRFLQSMGIGGAVVALIAAVTSLTALPAMLMLLGRRIGRRLPSPEREGSWYRFSQRVMRRPGLVAAATAAALVVVAVPSLRVHWTGVDASLLPRSKSARVVSDRLSADFPLVKATPVTIAIDAPAGAGAQLRSYARSAGLVPGITHVGQPRYLGAGRWELQATTAGSAIGSAARQAVDDLRALPTPYRVLVGGDAAEFTDMQAALGASLPAALLILAVATLLILWVMTGSVVLPVKALVMNALTVGVTTGTLVWIFQDGRLTGLLSYTPQGGIESADFLVLVTIAFALSTDYGVFLLMRIKEARDAGYDDREAVAVGLQRTGGIVTAAALLLAVAIGAFVTSQLIFLKQLGVGAAIAVLVDAFVVRALLVPSLMTLLGRWNWWQPRVLRRLHERIAVREMAQPSHQAATIA